MWTDKEIHNSGRVLIVVAILPVLLYIAQTESFTTVLIDVHNQFSLSDLEVYWHQVQLLTG